ncbi:MAG: STAS domain-containing protein [Actinobacteria bacterium]|nr:STAS domain-containing protein [Actinomycetota bacterium]
MSPGLEGPPSSPAPDRSGAEVSVFRLTERDLDGEFQELKVEGELDLSVVDRLTERITAARGRPVLVDLSECTFIDSTGIAAVLLARRDGGRVAIHSPSDQVLRVLAITGLTGDGVVFDDRREAMSGLAAQGVGD